MFRSIRFRLALWYTIVVAFVFIVVAWAIYEYINHTLSASLDQSLTDEVRWIAARFERKMLRSEADQTTREDIFEHATFRAVKEYIEVWDSSGKIFCRSPNLGDDDTLAGYARFPVDSTLEINTITTFRHHDIRLAVQRKPTGVVYLAMPTESITTPGNHLLRFFAWLGPLVIIIAAVGGIVLAKKSFAKINQVIEIAQRITADRLHDRIPEHSTKDEIGKIISTFNDMISRLDASFTQMKQFSADASHELRTPLTVMRSQLETALNSKVTHLELKKLVANCLDETLRMSGIIENLLLLAKGDTGQDHVKKERVDLRKLMSEIYNESVIIASQKVITVRLVSADPAIVYGDEQRLRQMLLNLIDNAVKYGYHKGNILLALGRKDGVATMRVTDDGIGIPGHDINRIFDRFYRVDRARSRELGGVGLGLAIAKWVAESHGGTITVASTVDKGSEFVVTLPLSPQ